MPADSNAEPRLTADVTRFMAAGKFRKARDAAKELCKLDRAAHLQKLVDANLALAEQMRAAGQISEAEQVLSYLRQIAPPEKLAGADLELLVAAKKWRQAAMAALDALPGTAAADALVLAGPENAPERLKPSDATELRAIWSALEATSRSDFPGAREFLRALAIQSPFAHWKLFLKGVVAFYSGDSAQADLAFQKLPEASMVARAARGFQFRKAESAQQFNAVCRVFQWEAKGELLSEICRAESISNQRGTLARWREVSSTFPSIKSRIDFAFADLLYEINPRLDLEQRHYDYLYSLGDSGRTSFERWLAARSVARNFPVGQSTEESLIVWVRCLLAYENYLKCDKSARPHVYYRLAQHALATAGIPDPRHSPSKLTEHADRLLKLCRDQRPDWVEPYLLQLETSEDPALREELRKRFPNSMAVRNRLGSEYLSQRKWAPAAVEFSAAQKLQPGDEQARRGRFQAIAGQALNHAARQPAKAVAILREAEESLASDPDDLQYGAVIYRILQTVVGAEKKKNLEETADLAAVAVLLWSYATVLGQEKAAQSEMEDAIVGCRSAAELIRLCELVRGTEWVTTLKKRQPFYSVVSSKVIRLAQEFQRRENVIRLYDCLGDVPAMQKTLRTVVRSAAGFRRDPMLQTILLLLNPKNEKDLPVLLERLEDYIFDAEQMGDYKTARRIREYLARYARRYDQEIQMLEDESDEDSAFFSPELIEAIRLMSPAEFERFRRDMLKKFPAELFDLYCPRKK